MGGCEGVNIDLRLQGCEETVRLFVYFPLYLRLRLLQMSFDFHLLFAAEPHADFTIFWLILSGGSALISTEVLPSFTVNQNNS